MSGMQKRCMVCGKPTDDGSTICRPCNESIRGEATGQLKRLARDAEKEIKRQGKTPPETTSNLGNKPR